MLAALALTAAAGVAGWFLRGGPRAGAPAAHFALTIPPGQRVTAWAEPGAALSADGRLLVYNADADGITRLYARRLTDPVGLPVPGTEGAIGPVLSPDDRWISFLGSENQWRKIPVQGGSSVAISIPPGLSVAVLRWNGMDGFVVTLANGALALLGNAGDLDTIARPDTALREQSLDVMEVLPSGHILVVATDQWPAGHLFTIDPKTAQRTPLVTMPASWATAVNGHLLWTDPVGVLFVAEFDGKKVTGTPRPFGVSVQTTRGGRPRVAVARTAGALAYLPRQQASLARVMRDGRVHSLLGEPRTYHNPRVSPDGRHVAIDIAAEERDVWLFDLADTTLNRVTFEGSGHDAVWAPDGRHLVFAMARDNRIGIYSRPADGSGATDSILTDGPQLTVHTMTPGARTGIAAKVTSVAGNGFDLVAVPLVGSDRKLTPLLTTKYMEGFPALSSDGKWLAYVGDESGRPEVYVRPFPGLNGKIVVSQNGGIEPVWSRNGRELFYIGLVGGAPHLMAAQVETAPQFRVLSRTSLFEASDFETATPHSNYDVMPDGQSFIMVRLGRASEFTYLQNWPAILKAQASSTP